MANTECFKHVISCALNFRVLFLKLQEHPWRILAICLLLGAAVRVLGGDMLDRIYTFVGMEPMPWQND
jgi:hypothetical protein